MRSIQEIFKLDHPPNNDEFVSGVMNFGMEFGSFCKDVLGYDLEPFHMEWIRDIIQHDRVAITAPTGFGKTTLLGNAYILWRTYFEKGKQFLIISNSMPQSIKILEEIRLIIENNELLRELMPGQLIKTNTWTKTEVRTTTDCKIMCKPYSENIRGYHVDYILSDEAATYRDQSIFFRYVVTRVNAKRGKVAVISTPVDVADLVAVLGHNPEWKSSTYRAVSPTGELLWPAKFDHDRLSQIRREIGDSAFEREYLCNPRAAADNTIFVPDLVEDAFDHDLTFGGKQVEDSMVYLGCDFAIATGPRADYDAYVIIERVGDKAIMRHGETHRGFSIGNKMLRIEHLFQQYKVSKIIVDPSNIGASIVEKLREKMLPFDAPVFSAQNRNKMLLNLRELFEQRRVIIPRNNKNPATITFTNQLVQQLLSFVETKTRAGFITYYSTAAHDDIVMGLMLACKPVIEQRECLDYIAV